jgi:hypothetical protein
MINRENITDAVATLRRVQIQTENDDGPFSFYMDTWGWSNECGTTACAGGWIAIDPVHNAKGLKATSLNSLQPIYKDRNGLIHLGSDALASYFGLPKRDTRSIFVHECWGDKELITAADVADALQSILDADAES